MKLTYNDETHVYMLDKKRCKGVTSIAKIPEDDFNIVRWKTRKIVAGMVIRPTLLEAIAAHHTDDAKLDDLCEQALTAAGGADAAEWGTAVHRVTERIDGSLELLETPMVKDVRDKWLGLLAAAGLEVIPHLRERVVIYPGRKICGKFDLLARVLPGGHIARRHPELVGRLVVCDLKTGKSSIKYPHSTAGQLALYAHAELLAGQWPELSGETETFEQMQEVYAPSLDFGFVIFIPPPETELRAGLYELDIARGWKAIEKIAFPALAWRRIKADQLCSPVLVWS